jgi:antitoxin VapB
MEAPMGDLAKVFWDGRDQAVRLPEEFRVEGSELRIRRELSVMRPIA